jgi:hypothetical protein
MDVLHGLDEVGLPEDEVHLVRLIDLDGLDVHGHPSLKFHYYTHILKSTTGGCKDNHRPDKSHGKKEIDMMSPIVIYFRVKPIS